MIAYADGRRRHEQMSWIARQLDADSKAAVSFHYSTLRGRDAPGLGAAAPSLWTRGDPARGLAACSTCHGADGQGLGPANPPLAGQPAAYLAEQLDQWRKGQTSQRSRRGDAANQPASDSCRGAGACALTAPHWPRILPFRNIGQHPPKHVMPVPEMMLQGRRYMCRNQHEQQNDGCGVNVLGEVEDTIAGEHIQMLQRHLRPGKQRPRGRASPGAATEDHMTQPLSGSVETPGRTDMR